MCRALLSIMLFLAFTAQAIAVDPEPAPKAPVLNKAEQAFKQMLDGATLVGQFSIDGKQQDKLTAERYSIKSVDKINDETWRFNVRIQYKKHDLTLPLPLTVLWAGDTPVITLTKMTIPPLGTFNARVLFHDNRYAGTWEHVGAGGGSLFGTIEQKEEK